MKINKQSIVNVEGTCVSLSVSFSFEIDTCSSVTHIDFHAQQGEGLGWKRWHEERKLQDDGGDEEKAEERDKRHWQPMKRKGGEKVEKEIQRKIEKRRNRREEKH